MSIGCYKTNAKIGSVSCSNPSCWIGSKSDMSHNTGKRKPVKKNDCLQSCKGYKYFALGGSPSGCWCGNSYGSQGPARDCAGEKNVGSNMNLVYAVKSPQQTCKAVKCTSLLLTGTDVRACRS